MQILFECICKTKPSTSGVSFLYPCDIRRKSERISMDSTVSCCWCFDGWKTSWKGHWASRGWPILSWPTRNLWANTSCYLGSEIQEDSRSCAAHTDTWTHGNILNTGAFPYPECPMMIWCKAISPYSRADGQMRIYPSSLRWSWGRDFSGHLVRTSKRISRILGSTGTNTSLANHIRHELTEQLGELQYVCDWWRFVAGGKLKFWWWTKA